MPLVFTKNRGSFEYKLEKNKRNWRERNDINKLLVAIDLAVYRRRFSGYYTKEKIICVREI